MRNAVLNGMLQLSGPRGRFVNLFRFKAYTTYAQPMHNSCIRSDVKEDKQNLTASERVTQMMEECENPVNRIPVCGLRMLR